MSDILELLGWILVIGVAFGSGVFVAHLYDDRRGARHGGAGMWLDTRGNHKANPFPSVKTSRPPKRTPPPPPDGPRCPASWMNHGKKETLSPLPGEENTYRCTCGCVFRWQDQWNWEILDSEGNSLPGQFAPAAQVSQAQ
jgi:hypothetical protein